LRSEKEHEKTIRADSWFKKLATKERKEHKAEGFCIKSFCLKWPPRGARLQANDNFLEKNSKRRERFTSTKRKSFTTRGKEHEEKVILQKL
jgi:hypothetical protein